MTQGSLAVSASTGSSSPNRHQCHRFVKLATGVAGSKTGAHHDLHPKQVPHPPNQATMKSADVLLHHHDMVYNVQYTRVDDQMIRDSIVYIRDAEMVSFLSVQTLGYEGFGGAYAMVEEGPGDLECSSPITPDTQEFS